MTRATPTPTPAPTTEEEILRLAREAPELGQAAVAERLQQAGHAISPSGVRYIWQRHDLETTAKRLKAIVDAAGTSQGVLTDNQRRLLERNTRSAGPADAEGGHELPERRQRILDTAAQLFSEAGYEGASIRDIAERVGLLPGSVYHYFRSKDELYLAVHRAGLQTVLGNVNAALATSTDPWERLRLACEVHVRGIVKGSPVERITGRSLAPSLTPQLRDRIRPDRDAYETVMRDVIDALPLAPGTDRSLLRLMLLGAMNWVFVWYQEGRYTPEEIADRMVEMVRRGVDESPER